MPYLRLYSRGLPIEQKLFVAQKLIDITLRTFNLPPEQRSRTTVQFITESHPQILDIGQALVPLDVDFKLEVIVHELTENKKRAFSEEAGFLLAHLAPTSPWERIARMVGIKAHCARQVELQFDELSPAVSDPLVVDSERLAA